MTKKTTEIKAFVFFTKAHSMPFTWINHGRRLQVNRRRCFPMVFARVVVGVRSAGYLVFRRHTLEKLHWFEEKEVVAVVVFALPESVWHCLEDVAEHPDLMWEMAANCSRSRPHALDNHRQRVPDSSQLHLSALELISRRSEPNRITNNIRNRRKFKNGKLKTDLFYTWKQSDYCDQWR